MLHLQVTVDRVKKQQEDQGVKASFFVDKNSELHMILEPTTPEGAKGRVCVTPSDTPHFKLKAIGDNAVERQKKLHYFDVDVDADGDFWAANSGSFQAIDPQTHPLRWGYEENRFLADGESAKGGSSQSYRLRGKCSVGLIRFHLRGDNIVASGGDFQQWENIQPGKYRVKVGYGCSTDSFNLEGQTIVVPNTIQATWRAACEITITIM